MLSHKHSKLFLEVGSTGLFLETWVTFDDIHQHTCMLYPDPGVMCHEWWLEVTSCGTGTSEIIMLSSNLACCTLPYDPPCALQRQEPPKMAMELSVYISILLVDMS